MRGSRLSVVQIGLATALIAVAAGIGFFIGGGFNRDTAIDLAALELPTGTPSPARNPTRQPAATTPTVAATQTPTVAVTPTAELSSVPTPLVEEPDIFIEDDFSTTANGWPQEETDTWSAGYEDGRYVLRLNGRTSIGFTTRLPADNYRLGIDLAVVEGGAGLVFLFAEPGTTYRFLVTPDGAYSIEQSVQQQQESIVTKIVDWTPHPALANSGGVNRLLVERQGQQIRFLAGETEITTFDIPEGDTSNRYGFVLTARSGQAQATFDNLLGERLP
jgi:hypothetical protein